MSYLDAQPLLAFHLLHLVHQHLRLLLLLLHLLQAQDLALLDLVDDNLAAAQGFLTLALLDLLLLLNLAQALQLHDLVLLLLLRLEVLPVALLFLQLALADGGGLRVGHHLVHLLHVIQLLLRDLHRPLVDRVALLQPLTLELVQRQLLLLLLLQPQHFLALGLGQGQLVLLLLLGQPPLLLELLLGGLADGLLSYSPGTFMRSSSFWRRMPISGWL